MKRSCLPFFLLLFSLRPATLRSQAQYRAFWVDIFHEGIQTPERVDQLIASAKRANANALVVQVRPRANSCYLITLEPIAVEPSMGCSPSFDSLADVLRKGKTAGLEVHAWVNVFTAWRAGDPLPADPRHVIHLHGPSKTGRDNWLSLSNTGQNFYGSYFLDPGHPDVAAYTADVIQHLVENYIVDGIHMDYVRYAENPSGGWGYNAVSVERFNRLFQRAGSPAAGDAAWMEFRRQQVTGLVRKIYLRAIRVRPEVKVSAALIAFGAGPRSDADWLKTSAYGGVFQNWWPWLQEGILDLGIVMNYDREADASQRAWFNDWIAFEKDRQGRRALLTGVAIYLNSVEDSLKQIARVLEPSPSGNRLAGFSLYSYAVTNCDPSARCPTLPVPNQMFYDALAQAYPQPAPIPPLPWKTAPERGHILGEVKVSGEPLSPLADGLTVTATPESGAGRAVTTDSTGYYGFVDLEPGNYTLTLARGSVEVFRSQPVAVSMGQVSKADVQLEPAAFTPAMPFPNANGVADAASFRTGALAPGHLLSLFGTQLASAAASATALPLPSVLGGTQVLINGRIAPLLYASPLQINMQAPFGLTGGAADVVVRINGVESAPVTVPLVEAAPGLFAAALHADYTPVSAAAPARAGEPILLFASGLGAVVGNITAGTAAPAPQPGSSTGATVARPDVRVGGRPAALLYSGLAPGFAGLYQVNITMPAGLPAGNAAVELTIAGRTSNSITLAVR